MCGRDTEWVNSTSRKMLPRWASMQNTAPAQPGDEQNPGHYPAELAHTAAVCMEQHLDIQRSEQYPFWPPHVCDKVLYQSIKCYVAQDKQNIRSGTECI